MNERIKELANQAKFMAEETINRKISANPELYAFAEKLAELIVKECAGIYSKIDNGNSHMGTDDYLEALHKTFFGVES
jgi:hypothetical protein